MNTFIKNCEQSIVSVLGQTVGGTWKKTELSAAPMPASDQDQITLRFVAKGALSGDLDYVISRSDASRLAKRFMGQEQDEEWSDDLRLACEELFAQISGELASNLAKEFGDVRIASCSQQDFGASGGRDEIMRFQDGSEFKPIVRIRISSDILSCLTQRRSELQPASQGVPEKNLELLKGIELSATLRFGQKRMPLREVLDLSAGAVIELDRQVQEPCELLVEGKLMARGEVVVIDGNYGLRVTDVLSEKERSTFVC